MSVYVPKTMIGRMALAIWHQVGKHDTPLADAQYILGEIRTPDMAVVRCVSQETGVPAATVDLCWTGMIDVILTQALAEDLALRRFKA